MIGFVERIPLRPRGSKWIHRERVSEWTASRTTAGMRDRIFRETHFDLVRAQSQPITVTQTAHVTGADGISFAIDKRAVRRGVRELPDTTTKCHCEVAFGQQTLWV